MTKARSRIFAEGITADKAVSWHLGRLVAELHPGKAIVDGVGSPFDLEEFMRDGQCQGQLVEDAHNELEHSWTRKHGLHARSVNAVWAVRWKEHQLTVVETEWQEQYQKGTAAFVVADTADVGRAFVNAACAWCNDPHESVLRFGNGCWSRSREMYAQIQGATFDDLVLANDLKDLIRDDFSTFLAARAEYERYGIPHKRGVLFTGPPGNGKTHCLRATLKFLGVPALYVMSLKDRYGTEEANIDRVFERARELTPCVLVFEDLDAMIHDRNRSYFLNQLDGIGSLSGVLTLATTNHPERLDPAIIDRPSRFDRKYHFALPAPAERRAYIQLWNRKLDRDMQVNDAGVDDVVAATDDFSFAYLKELYLSAMMKWVGQRKPGTMVDHLKEQLPTLREQMKAAAAAPTSMPLPPEDGDEPD